MSSANSFPKVIPSIESLDEHSLRAWNQFINSCPVSAVPKAIPVHIQKKERVSEAFDSRAALWTTLIGVLLLVSIVRFCSEDKARISLPTTDAVNHCATNNTCAKLKFDQVID